MARSVHIDSSKLQLILHTDPRADELTRSKAAKIISAAKTIFITEQVKDNEWRLSETTPPKYLASFKLKKVRRQLGLAWRATNDDPAWHWVEWGAHAGGNPENFVLGYRPLTKAFYAAREV